MSKTKIGTVKETGANANQQLIGIDNLNKGLIIEIFNSQKIGSGGRIIGGFKVLEVGNGVYSEDLKDFKNKEFTSAKEFIDEARSKNNNITHIINCNVLKIYS